MSNTPGISPITTDIEEIRHSDEDGFFNDEGDNAVHDEEATEDDPADIEVVKDDGGRVFNP